MTFIRNLFGLARAHPLAFVLFVVSVVLFLGGAVWWVVGKVFGLLRKVPGGGKVADTVTNLSAKTGSA